MATKKSTLPKGHLPNSTFYLIALVVVAAVLLGLLYLVGVQTDDSASYDTRSGASLGAMSRLCAPLCAQVNGESPMENCSSTCKSILNGELTCAKAVEPVDQAKLKDRLLNLCKNNITLCAQKCASIASDKKSACIKQCPSEKGFEDKPACEKVCARLNPNNANAAATCTSKCTNITDNSRRTPPPQTDSQNFERRQRGSTDPTESD